MKNHLSALLLAATTTLASAQPLIDGEVRKVDAAQKKITLKHGEIAHLDMPPMSMVFQVKDPALLARVKVGDKVRFGVDRIDGVYTVTAIESAR